MNRIGFYTGKIYKNDEMPEPGECCAVVTDEQLQDEDFVKGVQLRNKFRCIGCSGCLASQQENKK